MNCIRCLIVAAAIGSLFGCARRFGSDGMPTDMQGTWTFFAPFYHDSAKITFITGKFHARGPTQVDDASTLVIDGTYRFNGKTLHLTFESVVANISSKADKVPTDLIKSDVRDLLQVKTLDFQIVPKGNGVIELVASKNGPEGNGDFDFALSWNGSSPPSLSTGMRWVAANGTNGNIPAPPNNVVYPPVNSNSSYQSGFQPGSQPSQDQPAQQEQTQPQQQQQPADQPPPQSDPGQQPQQDPSSRPGDPPTGGSNPPGTG